MALPTTEQPKCSKEQGKKASNLPSVLGVNRRTATKAIKYGLRLVLLKPQVFRFLMVHVPEIIEKGESVLKDIVSFISDLL